MKGDINLETIDFLRRITSTTAVSGYEYKLSNQAKDLFYPSADEVYVDRVGNIVAHKKGTGNGKVKIMFAAHIDEIGLMVTNITEEGFLKFTSIGGVDQRTLPGQLVDIHGKEILSGIIAVNPDFLFDIKKAKKAFPMKEMFVDTGEAPEKLKELVRVGDIIVVRRNITELKNGQVYGKALDDRAGLAVCQAILREMKHFKNFADIYCVGTTQEELGYRGAITSSFALKPDIGIAIDVCHGHMPSVSEDDTSALGGGPVIEKGPQVHPGMFNILKEIAKKYGISWQLGLSNSPGGTDTWALQIANQGIPSALISLPLRYMHTSVEVVDLSDIDNSARLLALFVAHIDENRMEDLQCYYNN